MIEDGKQAGLAGTFFSDLQPLPFPIVFILFTLETPYESYKQLI